jgi:hypothetical protein
MRKESQGKYIYVYDPNNPMADKRGRVLEHRYVMAKHIGRPLLSTELVHHKNEDKKDNRIINLELTDRSQHSKDHNPKDRVGLTCPVCGCKFERQRSRIKDGISTCSRSCSVKLQIDEGRFPSGNKKVLRHGTEAGYRRKCRCDLCRKAHAEKHRRYRESKK